MLTDGGACTNCHSYPKGKNGVISETDGNWLHHSYVGRVGRKVQDQAEIEALGHVAGDPDTDGDGVPDRNALKSPIRSASAATRPTVDRAIQGLSC